MADIIIAVDEPLDATQCGGKGNCNGDDGSGRCMTHELWATLNQKMVEYLDSVSLKNLVDQQRAKQPAVLHDMREDAAVQQAAHTARGKSDKAAEKPVRARVVNSVFSLAQS